MWALQSCRMRPQVAERHDRAAEAKARIQLASDQGQEGQAIWSVVEWGGGVCLQKLCGVAAAWVWSRRQRHVGTVELWDAAAHGGVAAGQGSRCQDENSCALELKSSAWARENFCASTGQCTITRTLLMTDLFHLSFGVWFALSALRREPKGIIGI